MTWFTWMAVMMIERHLDDVPRRPRLAGHDSGLAPRKRIQEARLANIRRPHDCDPDAFAKDLAAAPIGERAIELRGKPPRRRQRFLEGALRDIALVRKVEARFHICHGPQKRRPPALVALPQRPGRLRERLIPLRRRPGTDKVRETLRFGQIELAVLESAPREFAGLGHSQTQSAKRLQHARDHGAPAVQMQFGHVLAREARRPRKPKYERPVQNLSVSRVAQNPETGHPGRRHLVRAQGLKRCERSPA